jgi:hypothetical protein
MNSGPGASASLRPSVVKLFCMVPAQGEACVGQPDAF